MRREPDGHPIPEALDPETGRIDALRLAAYLKLSVRDVAAMVERPERTVLANPTAPELQERLAHVTFVVGGLLAATGGDLPATLIWLTAPHPDLDDESPLDLMRSGELHVVADLVDDILSGAPT